MFAGSRDDQTSADAFVKGKATGAMSYAFIEVLKKNKHPTYLELLKGTRSVLANRFKQKPQLSTGHRYIYIIISVQACYFSFLSKYSLFKIFFFLLKLNPLLCLQNAKNQLECSLLFINLTLICGRAKTGDCEKLLTPLPFYHFMF